MIHIFNKVYITYAETFCGHESQSRVSGSFVRIIDKGLSFMYDKDYDKNLLCYGKSLKEVLDNYASEKDFFSTMQKEIELKKSHKVIIYADENSMLEFLIRWWKTLFPSITYEAAYSLYTNFGDSESLRSIRTNTFLDITVNSSPIYLKKIVDLYWSTSRSYFLEKFNSLEPFSLEDSFKKDCSVEYQILDYLAKGSASISPDLDKKIQHFYAKELSSQIFSLVKDCQNYLYKLAVEESVISSHSYLSTKSIKDVLIRDNRFRIISDPNVQDDLENLKYISDNYELLKICKDLISFELALNKKRGSDPTVVDLDHSCVNYFITHGSYPESKTILDLEIEGLSNFNIFDRLTNKKRMNPYLVSSFRNLINIKGLDDSLVSVLKF